MSNVPRACSEAVDLLWEHVHGGLDEDQTALVERHLAHCLRCCGEVVFVRELQRRLAGPPPSLPDDVEQRLMGFLDELETTPGGAP